VNRAHNGSSDFRGRNAPAAPTLKIAAVALSAMGLWLGISISRSAAQGAPSDVAYVEAVSGRVVASAQGSPALLDVLDIIGDRTRLDLQANSELRICHYGTRKFVNLKGPMRASVSAAGVTVENGNAVAASAEPCAAPVVSTFQGGIISRNIAFTTTDAPPRPAIKIVNRGTKTIRQISLLDAAQKKLPVAFERNMARPVLDEGQTYVLLVELGDGSELKMMLRAVAGARSGPLIVVVQ
jgi:hypothetical protein